MTQSGHRYYTRYGSPSAASWSLWCLIFVAAEGSHNSHPRWYFQILARFAPGLAKLLKYKLADASADIKAGLAVTAVAVPVGIAYAGLAGFRREVGLYSSLLPLVAYAIFGSSRQLIVGPDAATCAVIVSRRRSPRRR